jgi:endonuclease-3
MRDDAVPRNGNEKMPVTKTKVQIKPSIRAKAGKGRESQRIRTLFETFRAQNPAPTTELHYTTPFQLLVAVVLSAQMTDKGVNKATAPLFAKIQTPAQMVALREEGLLPYLASINYNRTKAKNVLALSRALVENHGGEIPQTQAQLTALPGVGNKTANVILNTLFHVPVIAVDTHVLRVSQRLGLTTATTPDNAAADLLKIIPPEFLPHAHHWLILHGRYVCTARSPRCGDCPVENLFPFLHKTYMKQS